MDQKDIEINFRLMEEMGLEEGPRRRIIDQDSGAQYQFKGRDIVAPGAIPGKTSLELDLLGNNRMMNFMFGQFIEKLQEDEEIPPVASYYTMQDNGKIRAAISMTDQTTIQSKSYNNETTCFADLILRLNGEEDVDLDEFDYERKKQLTLKPPKKTTKKSTGVKKNANAK